MLTITPILYFFKENHTIYKFNTPHTKINEVELLLQNADSDLTRTHKRAAVRRKVGTVVALKAHFAQEMILLLKAFIFVVLL
jgi:hypothetical protein